MLQCGSVVDASVRGNFCGKSHLELISRNPKRFQSLSIAVASRFRCGLLRIRNLHTDAALAVYRAACCRPQHSNTNQNGGKHEW